MSIIRNTIPIFLLIVALSIISCRQKASQNINRIDSDSAAYSPDTIITDFHADNDIAMLVSSIIDAINVNEKLDTAAYNFNGVLTDGVGAPLYLDENRNPGFWQVKVLDDEHAEICNLSGGDMISRDLVEYLVNCLALKAETSKDVGKLGETHIFTSKNCRLKFEGTAENGLSGNGIIITLSRR